MNSGATKNKIEIMRTWILSWLFLALMVIGFTLFTAFSAQKVSAQTTQVVDSVASKSGISTQESVVPSPVFLSGSRIRQSDVTSGDLVVASGNTVISGEVLDDVYVATGTLVIEGTVRGNVIVAAAEVIISPEARIDGSVIAIAQRLTISGEIGSSLQATGEQILLQGVVRGTSTVYAQKLTVSEQAQLNVLSGEVQELEEMSGASVGSREDFQVLPREERATRPGRQLGAYMLWGGLQGAFLGFVVWWLTRTLWPGALVQLQTQLASVLAWGLTLGLVWPAIGLLLLATIIGFPLMILGTTLWLGFLWLGWVIPALAVATHAQFLPSLSKMPVWSRVLLVTAAWGVVMTLPWVGWMVRIASGLVGLGLVVLLIRSRGLMKPRTAGKK